jgi:hypothetical protein
VPVVADIDTFVQSIADVANQVPVSGALQLCRDPNDDVVLEAVTVSRFLAEVGE